MALLRADVCDAADFAARDRLLSALAGLGYLGDTDHADLDLGPGLSRFRRGADEVTVFVDAWAVDVAGPPAAVRELLAALAGPDYE